MIADLNDQGANAQTKPEIVAVRAWRERRDEAAANWLVEEYRALLRNIAARRLPEAWMIDEVVQEVFSRAFAALDRYDTARPLPVWLASITVNACRDKLTAWHRRNLVFVGGTFVEEHPGSEVCAGEALAAEETRSGLEAVIGGLRASDREIFTLYHLDGLSAQEVAERTGLSEGNVRVRALRARTVLRERATAWLNEHPTAAHHFIPIAPCQE